MTDKPIEIQRYNTNCDGEFSVFMPDESFMMASDVEAYVAAKVKEEVETERKRCRIEELDPVINALEDAIGWFDLDVDYETLSAEAEKYRAIIASVRKIRREKP